MSPLKCFKIPDTCKLTIAIVKIYFYYKLWLFCCKILKKEKESFPLDQTSTVLFLSLVEWPVVWLLSADRLLNFMLHYKDVVEFSWGGCDGVDISSNKYLYQWLDFHFFLFKTA